LLRLREETALETMEREDATRMIEHAGRAIERLHEFRAAVVRRHLERIEQSILEGYRKLLRKRRLVHSAKVCPTTFRVQLFGVAGNEVSPSRLSAGERQLLAVSILWGLAKASGHSLPVVIDTPLGRLDASHRMNLVRDYFPHASHQVVLLSTDEEIGEVHVDHIRSRIGRTYRLMFDDSTQATEIIPGYFE
jgi:DNA sulfur modification protein DndD